MRNQFKDTRQNTHFFYWVCTVYILSMSLSCSSTKTLDQGTVLYSDGVDNTVTVSQSHIPDHDVQTLETLIMAIPVQQFTIPRIHTNDNLLPAFPVAQQIVKNYLYSSNKEPGGHCLTVSKTRFLNAYQQVYGRSVYQDLPERMATKYYTPRQVFDNLYASTSGTHKGWRTLPKKFRGSGNAGAIACAGMGELLNGDEIWSGQLRPGAPMQVWRDKNDYREVVKGISDPEIDPFGHSFIFLSYVRDAEEEIVGIKIADQGYQSQRTLVQTDYAIWWGVNLKI
jgi:hypothetical protein